MDPLSLKHDWANGEKWDETQHNTDIEAIETAINILTQSTDASNSGAHNIKCAAILGVEGTTVYAKLVALKALIDATVAGSIPDGSITEDMLSFTVATQAELDALAGTGNTQTVKSAYDLANAINTVLTTAGDMFGRDSNGLVRIPKGTARQILGMNATATTQEYLESLQSLMTAQGDMVYASSANTPARLAKGTAGQVLQMNSGATAPEWSTRSANGYTNSTQFISGSSNATITIPLGVSANKGMVGVYHYGGYDNGVLVMVSKDLDYAMSMGHDQTFDDQFYSYRGQSALSRSSFATAGGDIYLKSAVINSTNLELTFHNSNTGSKSLAVYISWEVDV